MTTLTAARRQILDGLLAELAADERLSDDQRCDVHYARSVNRRMGKLDAAESDLADDDATVALWDESGDRP